MNSKTCIPTYFVICLGALALGACSIFEREDSDDTAALAALLAVASQAASASDSNDGDEGSTESNSCTDCTIYATSATFTGSEVGGVTQADAVCNSDSNKPDAAEYKAWLGASNRSGGVFQTDASVTYSQPDGDTIKSGGADREFYLWPDGFSTSLDSTEWTGPGLGARIWRGIPGSTTASETCDDWTIGTNAENAQSALPQSASSDFQQGIGGGLARPCDDSLHLICVQQTIAD